MLYDAKRWDKKVKPDPWSLAAFIAWAETQPANKTYDYCEPYSCAIAQWRWHLGFKESDLGVLSGSIPTAFKKIVHEEGNGGRSTYGKLLERYRRTVNQ